MTAKAMNKAGLVKIGDVMFDPQMFVAADECATGETRIYLKTGAVLVVRRSLEDVERVLEKAHEEWETVLALADEGGGPTKPPEESRALLPAQPVDYEPPEAPEELPF
jgi:hypothetical protein